MNKIISLVVATFGILFCCWNITTETVIGFQQKLFFEVEKDVSQKISWGMSQEEFNYDFSFPADDRVIEIAKGMRNNELVVEKQLKMMPYSLETLDWNVLYSESPNTFQLYLQALYPVSYLTKAYKLTNEKLYLDLAFEFVKSWDIYRESESSKGNNFVWYDHGTALRADCLIYFILSAEEEEYFFSEKDRVFLRDLLIEHAEWLAEDKNYTKNHNHGIFQDQALLYCAYICDDEKSEEWIDIATSRLDEQKNFAFTSEMVHVENSPSYQIGVVGILQAVAEFLEAKGHEYGNELARNIEESEIFITYLTKPNRYLAEIGDSSSAVLDAFAGESLEWKYAATMGKEGNMPEREALFLPISGYYISHNSWEKENYENSTWMMFKSGYSSKTHKHADDNSFMLYSKGHDIFVDTGWYNYMSGNRYRDYFTSANSHNTVIVDGKSYSPTEENSSKAGIFTYTDGEEYDYVLGYNEMYEGVSFDRHFYNLGEAIIIYDNIVAEEEHTYSQLLHLSEDMTLITLSDTEALYQIGAGQYYVRIKQLVSNGKNAVIHGDYGSAEYGYISRKMNHLDTIDTLKYDVTGRNVDIVTLITIEDKNGNVDGIDSIDFLPDYKFIHVNAVNKTYDIKLEQRERLKLSDIVVSSILENNFKFQNMESGGYYAWYIVDKQSAAVKVKKGYSQDSTFEYTFSEENKEYLLKAYVKSLNGRYRTSKIVAEIGWNEELNKYVLKSLQDDDWNLSYFGHKMECIEDGYYRFSVLLDYKWNYKVHWYVYKNGGYYSSFMRHNESCMEFEFIEPGTYTVMYYLKTPNGDNEFWNFSELVIE